MVRPMAEYAIALPDRHAHLSVDAEERLFAIGLNPQLDLRLYP